MNLSSLVGTVFADKYELLSLSGQGGMGAVFRARQRGLDRTVAVKIMSPELLADEESRLRFEREARAISLLSHPHIATFLSYGFDGNLPYIALEFLEGQSLQSLLSQEGAINWKRALKIGSQISSAMQYAHEAGVIHRDLKPSNIILETSPEPDYVKIVDFGLARNLEVSALQDLTKTGELIGSVHHLSPEQCKGKRADQRSDIYALACIVYQLISGEHPFDADNPVGIIHKHLNEQAMPLSRISKKGDEIPRELDRLVMKGLCKDADGRYQSMAEMNADIVSILEGRKLRKSSTATTKTSSKISPLVLTPAILLLISSLVYFGLYTESGGAATLKAMLFFSAGKEEISASILIFFEKLLLKEGGRGDKLRTELVEQLAANKDRFAASRLFIRVAERRRAQGDMASAGAWALQAIFALPRDGNLDDSLLKTFHDLLEESAGIAVQSKELSVSRPEFSSLLKIAAFAENNYCNTLSLLNLINEIFMRQKNRSYNRDLVNLLQRRLVLLAKAGQTKEVRQAYWPLVSAMGRLDGNDTPSIPLLYFQTARNFTVSGKFNEASLYLQAGNLAWKKTSEPGSSIYGEALCCQASVLRNMGKLDEALRITKQAVNMCCSVAEVCQPCLHSLDALAELLEEKGDYSQCIAVCLRRNKIAALLAFKTDYDSLSSLNSYKRLLRCYLKYGKVIETRKLLADALSLELHTRSPLAVLELNDLYYHFLFGQGDFAEAEKVLLRCRALVDLGKFPTFEKQKIIGNQINLLLSQNQDQKAKPLVREYLEFLSRGEYVDFQQVLYAAASEYKRTDRAFYEEIIEAVEKFAATRKSEQQMILAAVLEFFWNLDERSRVELDLDRFLAYKDLSAKTRAVLYGLKARYLIKLGKRDEVRNCLALAMKELQGKTDFSDDIDSLVLAHICAAVLLELNSLDEEEEFLRNLLAKRKQAVFVEGPKQEALAQSWCSLYLQMGHLEYARGKFEEAKQSFLAGRSLLRNFNSYASKSLELSSNLLLAHSLFKLWNQKELEPVLNEIIVSVCTAKRQIDKDKFSLLTSLALESKACGKDAIANQKLLKLLAEIADLKGWHDDKVEALRKL